MFWNSVELNGVTWWYAGCLKHREVLTSVSSLETKVWTMILQEKKFSLETFEILFLSFYGHRNIFYFYVVFFQFTSATKIFFKICFKITLLLDICLSSYKKTFLKIFIRRLRIKTETANVQFKLKLWSIKHIDFIVWSSCHSPSLWNRFDWNSTLVLRSKSCSISSQSKAKLISAMN